MEKEIMNCLVTKIITAFNGDIPLEELTMGTSDIDEEEDRIFLENHYKKIGQLLENWIKENDVKAIKILCSDESSLRDGEPLDPKNVSKYVDDVMPEDDWYDIIHNADKNHYWANAGDEFAWTENQFLLGSGAMTNIMVLKIG